MGLPAGSPFFSPVLSLHKRTSPPTEMGQWLPAAIFGNHNRFCWICTLHVLLLTQNRSLHGLDLHFSLDPLWETASESQPWCFWRTRQYTAINLGSAPSVAPLKSHCTHSDFRKVTLWKTMTQCHWYQPLLIHPHSTQNSILPTSWAQMKSRTPES